IHAKFERVIFWAANKPLQIFKYNELGFIDATVKIAPSQFSQCLIIIMFDREKHAFVLWVYARRTKINEYLYCRIIVLLEYSRTPCSIVCDFEKVVWNSVE
ncbi:hypothetical protein HZS_7364, partial [Henneguya salminicola]